MKNIVFVQFYSKVDTPGRPNHIELGNGFSDTHDFCKNIGDIVWLEYIFTDDLQAFDNIDFVISEGTAYISASYTSHVYQVYRWSLRYPKVNFIVGGPIVSSNCLTLKYNLPHNMTLIKGSVEDYFSIPNFSFPWKIEIPTGLTSVTYSYTLENKCYWRKCSFCTFCNVEDVKYRSRKEFNFEFKDVEYNGKTSIRIGSDSLTPFHIKSVVNKLPTFKQLKRYRIFIRCASDEFDAIKQVSNLDRLSFTIGLEFPSQRMWNCINKGYDYDVAINMINYLLDNGANVNLGVITGWNNLIAEDIEEMKKFMNSINRSNNICLVMHELFIYPTSNLYDCYEKGEVVEVGPFMVGFYPKLKEEQLGLNKTACTFFKKWIERRNRDMIIKK